MSIDKAGLSNIVCLRIKAGLSKALLLRPYANTSVGLMQVRTVRTSQASTPCTSVLRSGQRQGTQTKAGLGGKAAYEALFACKGLQHGEHEPISLQRHAIGVICSTAYYENRLLL